MPADAPITDRLTEFGDVLDLRHRTVVRAAGAFSVAGLLITVVAPGLLPSAPVVGTVVGLLAGALAAGVAVAVDSADAVVQGPRHVRALDGTVLAEVPAGGGEESLTGLARTIARDTGGGAARVAVTAVSGAPSEVAGWAERLARAAAGQPRRVMMFDAVRRAEPGSGIVAVADGDVELADAARFDDELLLATVGASRDAVETLRSVPALLERLPPDIELVVVALPSLLEAGALAPVAACDRVLVLVEEGTGRRVDLLAALDAVDTTGTAVDVVMLTQQASGASGQVGRPGASQSESEPEPPLGATPPPSRDPAPPPRETRPARPRDAAEPPGVEAPEPDSVTGPGGQPPGGQEPPRRSPTSRSDEPSRSSDPDPSDAPDPSDDEWVSSSVRIRRGVDGPARPAGEDRPGEPRGDAGAGADPGTADSGDSPAAQNPASGGTWLGEILESDDPADDLLDEPTTDAAEAIRSAAAVHDFEVRRGDRQDPGRRDDEQAERGRSGDRAD